MAPTSVSGSFRGLVVQALSRRGQVETRQGRAELLLADSAAAWNAGPESRQLPSPWQWLRIRWLTHKETWTPPQRKMMRKAARFHAVPGAALALLGAAA